MTEEPRDTYKSRLGRADKKIGEMKGVLSAKEAGKEIMERAEDEMDREEKIRNEARALFGQGKIEEAQKILLRLKESKSEKAPEKKQTIKAQIEATQSDLTTVFNLPWTGKIKEMIEFLKPFKNKEVALRNMRLRDIVFSEKDIIRLNKVLIDNGINCRLSYREDQKFKSRSEVPVEARMYKFYRVIF